MNKQTFTLILSSLFFILNLQTGFSQCAQVVTGVLSATPVAGSTCDFVAEVTVIPTGGNGNFCFRYNVLVNGAMVNTVELTGQSGVLDIMENFNAECAATIQITWTSFTSPQCNGNSCNSGTLDLDLPAPVELTFFEGKTTTRTNVLNWATASEENVAHFVVEKSSNGKDFYQEVGYLAAAGFSSSPRFYQLEDKTPQALTYYRLRSVDFDGSEQLSDIVSIERKGALRTEIMTVSPVPFKQGQTLQITCEAETRENVILSIADIAGRELYTEQMQLEEGVYNWTIDLTDFNQNLLIAQLRGKNGTQTKMIPVINQH